MLAQVAALEGKDDIPCVVTVDNERFLPEFTPSDPTNSCLGGFVMYARKNRIVCSQTLDDRLSMTFQQSIPAMRASLFPSLTKQRNQVNQWVWLAWTRNDDLLGELCKHPYVGQTIENTKPNAYTWKVKENWATVLNPWGDDDEIRWHNSTCFVST